jgi:hypothetical protein
MRRIIFAGFLFVAGVAGAFGQREGAVPTQALVFVGSKTPVAASPSDVTLKLENKTATLTSFSILPPKGVQVALLIDDGLRTSVGRELQNLRAFVQGLRPGTEVFVGYMRNGQVDPAQGFTTDLTAAANSLRIPVGAAGVSASPYFCLSDFVKRWPVPEEDLNRSTSAPVKKARFVLMITNGVDPYNGSTSITNQSSPYVDAAVTDAQRAGIPVYSIYFSDAGIRGPSASFSGQNYLTQLAQGTGGTAYYQGTGNPVSMAPFLKQFTDAIAETYVATFEAPGNKDFVRVKFQTSLPKVKLQAPSLVKPGTMVLRSGE